MMLPMTVPPATPRYVVDDQFIRLLCLQKCCCQLFHPYSWYSSHRVNQLENDAHDSSASCCYINIAAVSFATIDVTPANATKNFSAPNCFNHVVANNASAPVTDSPAILPVILPPPCCLVMLATIFFCYAALPMLPTSLPPILATGAPVMLPTTCFSNSCCFTHQLIYHRCFAKDSTAP